MATSSAAETHSATHYTGMAREARGGKDVGDGGGTYVPSTFLVKIATRGRNPVIGRGNREAILTRLRCGSDKVAVLPSFFFPRSCLLLQAQWDTVGLPVDPHTRGGGIQC